MTNVRRIIDHVRFLYVQRITGYSVPSSPLFGSEAAVDWFSEQLRKCRSYFEYGSGGSTCYAAAHNKRLVTIDSDPYFLAAVKSAITTHNNYRPDRQTFIHRDVGPITWWGTPILNSSPGKKRAEKFRQYSDPPLHEFGGDLPDLILVDGRFRLASALKTMRALAYTTGWSLVVDDYSERPHYHALEQFAHLSNRVGRLAIFDSVRPCADLDEFINTVELDCR